MKLSLTFIVAIFISSVTYAQSDSILRAQIQEIAKDVKGTVGFSMLGIENRDTLSHNGREHLPMQSVMKFPIAITVLHWIDEGTFTLDQTIHIDKSDLAETYSLLRDKYPEGNINIIIRELLSYMVSLSDNDACDILLKTLGGTDVVNTYMHSFGIKQIAIKATEYQMA